MKFNWKLNLFFSQFPKKSFLVCSVLSIIVIIKRLFLDSIPALFWGADVLGILFENVTFGLVASLFFYLGVNFRERFQVEVELGIITREHLKRIESHFYSLISSLTSGEPPPVDQNALSVVLSKHRFLDECAGFGWNDRIELAPWREYFGYTVLNIEKSVEKIIRSFELRGCLRPDLILLLEKLLSAKFSSSVKWYCSASLANTNMSHLGPHMWLYKTYIDELIIFYRQNYGYLNK